MRNLFYLLFVLLIGFNVNAQECSCLNETLILHIVDQEGLSHSPFQELKDYLFIIELNSSKLKVKDIGIYKFGLSITHTKRYLLLKNRDSCEFLDLNSIEDGIIHMCKFFRENSGVFTADEITDYIEKVIMIYKSNRKTVYLNIENDQN